MKYVINFLKSTITLGETVSFYMFKALSKTVYALIFAVWHEEKNKAQEMMTKYNIKLENLELKEKEVKQRQKEVEEMKKELQKIKGLGDNAQSIINGLHKQIDELKKKLENQREEIKKIKQIKKRLSFVQIEAQKADELEKQVALLTKKQKGEDPLVESFRIEIDNLKETINLLKEGARSGIPLKSQLRELEIPKLKRSKNPFVYLKNLLEYRKHKKEFTKVYNKLGRADFNYFTKKDNDKFKITIKTKGKSKLLPESIIEKERCIKLNDKYVRVYYLADLPTILSPYVLFKLINAHIPLRMSLFVKPFGTGVLRKKVDERIATLESQQNDRMQKGKRRDMDIDKELDELNQFVQELVHSVEKGYLVSMYVGIDADSEKKLKRLHKEFQNLVDSIEFTFNTYSFGQRKAFETLLPFNEESIKKDRVLPTTAVAYLTPFLSKQLNDPTGIFLGFNAYNGSLVLIDFFKARNKNINIFGTSGSGKSVTTKLMAMRLYIRGVQTLIIDPEGEYKKLAKAIGGEIVEFSRDNGINPFYIGSSSEDDILNHVSMLKTFFKFFIPDGKYDSAVLDNKLVELYETYEPNFDNFLKLINNTSMYEYLSVLVKGSLRGIFNAKSELNLEKDFIVFDISSLDSDDKKSPAMYLLTSLIWNIVNKDMNKELKKSRMLFIDEAHTLLVDREVAIFYKDIVKRARKRNLGVVSVTQNVEDFIENEFGKGIITNAETTILLKQHQSTVAELGDIFQISDEERDMLGTLAVGESVLFREKEHVRLNIHPLPSEFTLVKT